MKSSHMPHMTDEDREALAKKALISLGRKLGRLRQEAGYSQWDFAPLTGYSRGRLSDAELGRNWLCREFWEAADAALKTNGSLVAAFDRIAYLHRDKRRTANSPATTQPANPERGKVTPPRSAVPHSAVVYLTVAEVAKITRVSKMTVYRLVVPGNWKTSGLAGHTVSAPPMRQATFHAAITDTTPESSPRS